MSLVVEVAVPAPAFRASAVVVVVVEASAATVTQVAGPALMPAEAVAPEQMSSSLAAAVAAAAAFAAVILNRDDAPTQSSTCTVCGCHHPVPLVAAETTACVGVPGVFPFAGDSSDRCIACRMPP